MNDYRGVPVTKGCRVRQRNVFDPGMGAKLMNVNRQGTVLGLGRTRVVVQFDDRTTYSGFRPTDTPAMDRVRADYPEVLPSA